MMGIHRCPSGRENRWAACCLSVPPKTFSSRDVGPLQASMVTPLAPVPRGLFGNFLMPSALSHERARTSLSRPHVQYTAFSSQYRRVRSGLSRQRTRSSPCQRPAAHVNEQRERDRSGTLSRRPEALVPGFLEHCPAFLRDGTAASNTRHHPRRSRGVSRPAVDVRRPDPPRPDAPTSDCGRIHPRTPPPLSHLHPDRATRTA